MCERRLSPPATLHRFYSGVDLTPIEIRTGPAVKNWRGERRWAEPERVGTRHRVTWMLLDRRFRPSRRFCFRGSFRLPRRNFPSRASLSLP